MAKDIVIILEESVNAKDFSVTGESDNAVAEKNTGTLIHQEEFKKVGAAIKKKIPENDDDANRIHLHNTITILGTRGSGKTSFLLSIKKSLEKNEEIEVLDIIDPTLIEEKGHVFLNAISLIIDCVEKVFNKQECSPSNGKTSAVSRKEWRSSLNKLAAGLPSIDGLASHNAASWQDPEFVMDNGLKAVAASQQLGENFNEFLKKSLSVLGKKSFLLMFDDIDVDASKGWAVLETIRKYFTSKRLITLISGDLELYSTVVRQKKWKNFGEEILKHEGSNLGKLQSFNNMITELESQYLQKILQPRNRIHLPTINELKFRDLSTKIHILKKSSDPSEKQDKNEINDLYKRILSSFGIYNRYQADAYLVFLLSLPLRTQIQFLSLFKLENGEFDLDSTGNLGIPDVFISDLYSKKVDVSTVVKNPRNLNRIILNFLTKERKLEELYQLQPITTDSSLNGSLFVLNLLLSYGIKNDSYLIFDYFIKVGYLRNLLPQLGYSEGVVNTNSPSLDGLVNNSVILNDNVLRDIVGRITAYIRGTMDKGDVKHEQISKAGTIPLYSTAAAAKKNRVVTSDRIDNVLKDASYVEWTLVYMPLSANQYVYKQSSLLTYSSYTLLGAIGELIRKGDLEKAENSFSELSQLRGYMMPDFKRGNNDIPDDGEEKPAKFPVRKASDFKIENKFKEWLNSYPNNLKLSAHLLGKVATRHFYALTNLESKVGTKKLGDVFHAHLVAFMNAILIEDCRENTDFISELNLNNTNYKDVVFENNLSKVSEKIKLKTDNPDAKDAPIIIDLSFSQWMLACPLIVAYLTKKQKLMDNLFAYCNSFWAEEILQVDLQKYLSKIPIKGDASEIVRQTRTRRSTNNTASE